MRQYYLASLSLMLLYGITSFCYYISNVTICFSVILLLCYQCYCMLQCYTVTVLLMLLCSITLFCFCATGSTTCYSVTLLLCYLCDYMVWRQPDIVLMLPYPIALIFSYFCALCSLTNDINACVQICIKKLCGPSLLLYDTINQANFTVKCNSQACEGLDSLKKIKERFIQTI